MKEEPIRVAEGYAIPGPEVSCMDAAEMLVDGFIRDTGIFPDRQDRNELVRRMGLLLSMQREALKREYMELVDALCSPSWMGRNRHASVVALAKRLHDSQTKLRPLELEDVALAAGYCVRKSGHDGPCNGLPRNDCFAKTPKAPKPPIRCCMATFETVEDWQAHASPACRPKHVKASA